MRVFITGDLTVRSAESTQSFLLGALRDTCAATPPDDSVELDCSGIEEIDLSAVQLMISFRKSAAAHGKAVRFSPPLSAPLQSVLRRCGLLGQPGDTTWQDEKFWTTTEVPHE